MFLHTPATSQLLTSSLFLSTHFSLWKQDCRPIPTNNYPQHRSPLLQISVSASPWGLNEIISKLLSQEHFGVLCFSPSETCISVRPFLNPPVALKMSGEHWCCQTHRWHSDHRGQVGRCCFLSLSKCQDPWAKRNLPAGLALAGPHVLLTAWDMLSARIQEIARYLFLPWNTTKLRTQASKPSSSGCTGAYLPKVMSQNDVHDVGRQAWELEEQSCVRRMSMWEQSQAVH